MVTVFGVLFSLKSYFVYRNYKITPGLCLRVLIALCVVRVFVLTCRFFLFENGQRPWQSYICKYV